MEGPCGGTVGLQRDSTEEQHDHQRAAWQSGAWRGSVQGIEEFWRGVNMQEWKDMDRV